MKCPRCSSPKSSRYLSPVTKDEVVLRRHRCLECGLVYLSAQVVVTGDMEEALLEALEP